MAQKTAYFWGPVSSFSGPLVAQLLHKGWHVHMATKSALNLLTLVPLDMRSAAQAWLERALGGRTEVNIFQERLCLLNQGETAKGTTYDAVIFSALPPNFDEPRAPRAPWAASELLGLSRLFKDVPMFIVSSLWGAVQSDCVVPEEFEFERRKPLSQWEAVCQQYEHRLLQGIASLGVRWHLVRLPLVAGSTIDGRTLNFSGLSQFLRTLSAGALSGKSELKLSYNPDGTLWFSPVNTLASLFWRLLEDQARPRICNLVATENILNRQWMQSLAVALGYGGVEAVEDDAWNLPGILRKMLKDALQVKTRNLFEVAGRYNFPPPLLDAAYFKKWLAYGTAENWGRLAVQDTPEIPYTRGLTCAYFQEFLPGKLCLEEAAEITRGGTTLGFYIAGSDPLSFLLKASNGRVTVEELKPESDPPAVSFHLSGQTMARLIENKLSLPKALLSRAVRMEGSILDGLRVSKVLSRFLQNNPYTADSNLNDD